MDFYTSCFQYKGKLLVIGYENGRRILKREPYRPYLFLPGQDGYHTIFGEPLAKMQFDSIYDASAFTKKYADVEGFKTYGISNWPYQYLYETFGDCSEKYDASVISVVAIDIETDVEGGYPDHILADKEVTAITLSKNGKKWSLGLKDFDTTEFPDVTYFKCKDEKHLLKCFLSLWNSETIAPDIVTGWNIDGFDIPYLIRRIKRILGEAEANKLSPWGVIETREVFNQYGKMVEMYTIIGVASLDYMQLYIKFVVPSKGRPESMSLDYISSEELGIRKLDYSEYGDLGRLYIENPQLYMTYNVRDVDLIDRLEAKMKLIEIALVFAYDAGCNYADVFGTVRPWDAIIHRYLMDRKVVVPFQKLTDKEYKIEGGFVKDPLLGKHHWVASIDLKSSYPHQIMQYNMGPETKVDKVEGINAAGIVSGSCDPYRHVYDHVCVSGNGARFRTDVVSFLSTLMSENFNKRKRYKALMEEHEKLAEQATEPAEKKKHLDIATSYDNKQHSLKIKINALYGSLANKYCRWYDPDIAESITQSGQLAIRWAQKTVNELLNKICKTTNHDYIIAIDTDSLYISLERLIDMKYKDQTNVDEIVTFIDTFMKSVILPTIESSYQKMVETTNAHSQRMSMNREVIASAGIWTGKKHYILKMYDKEGFRYDPPKFKLVGIEAVRSSTAGAARERIKKAIEVIMNEDEVALQRYVSECRREFMTLPIPDIATPKSANEVDKWKDSTNLTAKGTPLQVKALIYHNELLKRLEITKYPELKAGDKIKYVYLKDPNPYGITCIGFMNILPPEFGLDEFVDRTVQFNKGLLEPLNTITNVIGWSPKPRATLDAFLS